MNDTTTAETQRATTAPGNPAVPDDLRVVDWLETSDPDLGLEADDMETVGNVRQALHDVYLSDSDYQYWSPAVFSAADGRVYTVEIGVIVRPATQEEVRKVIEEERESTFNPAKSRIEMLDGYLRSVAT
jgi:hypothetical protein